ncbi:MAG: TRIC cation channel family protein [Coriobacteriia bacterium]|nr:TRIC cation channel family protein [Coriobacteriia bacterium]
MATATIAPSPTTTETIETIITTVVPSVVASALPSTVTTTVPVTATSIGLPVAFEIAAIFTGALSGAMRGVNRKLDITGVIMLALVNGLGGGMLRDVLLGQDVFALKNPRALISVLAAAAVAFFFISIAKKLQPATKVIDAFSLALFCLVGADKALVAGLTIIPSIMMGTTTSIGGSVLRDILTGEVPETMQRGHLYAIAAGCGSAVFVLSTSWLSIAKPIALIVAASVTFVLRVGSLWRGWESPEPHDMSYLLIGPPRRLIRAVRSRLTRRL